MSESENTGERKYSYQNAQESILLPFYGRFVWEPLLEIIPRTLSPNAITLISTLCCFGSFVLAATGPDDPIALVVAAILVFTYMTLDNIDGAQARRTGRSSRLGEFLDHWLDTFNNGWVVLGACLAAGLEPILALGVLAAGTLAFLAVQLELQTTGVFRMGRIGDVEGNTVVSLLYLLLAATGPELFRAAPIPGLPPIAVWLGLAVAGQALMTFASALRRTEGHRFDLLPCTLLFALLYLWALHHDLSPFIYLTLGFFVNPICTSRPVRDRVLGSPGPPTHWIALGLLFCGALLDVVGLVQGMVAGAALVGVYTSLCIYHFAAVTTALRREAAMPTEQHPSLPGTGLS
ncbi:MAG: CDP-alcohol phosphatidyltransferase family protein [Deltaproteobacteria bacterium]|nr:CDP-alcohol phosphatidyltransferase family protein [Deltaproteobacteria bacterium]MBW2383105.1 CDP-alcohol phosphatidyltransferase family protein [Deltaproteobacteria bacterium]MBW2697593.1 CDP-alcohol phosphatidyltransferase family protein [Deltaproteobacteria bacterium]